MSSQIEVWNTEHREQSTFTRIHSDKPSGPLPSFAYHIATEFFWKPEIFVGDIGCGKGRNSLYLAKLGFTTWGVDFSEEAVSKARKRCNGINSTFEVADLTREWSIGDGKLDAIVDCNTTICIPNPGREFSISEGRRVLRHGGLYLFYGVARSAFVDASPGPEPNSAIFSRTGKFEKQYTREELLAAYKDFQTVSLEESVGHDVIEGKETEYSMWIAMFKKPD